jgi:predicted glycoside hydrolase/deacetylase ChbG (UPF0249 family)
MKVYAVLKGDDVGLSPGSDRGIIKVSRDGIMTSASLA